MSRRLKRPDGEVVEEVLGYTAHLFLDGEMVLGPTGHNNTPGDYTGRFSFTFSGGEQTRWYTKSTAPKWLLALYVEATNH